ncbi:MAG: transcriptional repressor LexA [Planctomycetota bacterium]
MASRSGRKPVTEITGTQQRTLREILRFTAHHGFPPTMADLAASLDISHASAHEQVCQLERRGYVRREPNKARGLVVLKQPVDDVENLVPVPIIGTVAAGVPIFAEQNRVGEVLVTSSVVRTGHCFALRVTGDSMTGAGIRDRDLVIVRQQPVAESGDIVVALLGDDATVKRLFIQEHQIELRSENRKYKPMSIGAEHDLRIIGKVVAVRRDQNDNSQGRGHGNRGAH